MINNSFFLILIALYYNCLHSWKYHTGIQSVYTKKCCTYMSANENDNRNPRLSNSLNINDCIIKISNFFKKWANIHVNNMNESSKYNVDAYDANYNANNTMTYLDDDEFSDDDSNENESDVNSIDIDDDDNDEVKISSVNVDDYNANKINLKIDNQSPMDKLIEQISITSKQIGELSKETSKQIGELSKENKETSKQIGELSKENKLTSKQIQNLIGYNQKRDNSYESQMGYVVEKKLLDGEIFSDYDFVLKFERKYCEIRSIILDVDKNYLYGKRGEQTPPNVYLDGFEWDTIFKVQSKKDNKGLLVLIESKTSFKISDLDEVYRRLKKTAVFLKFIEQNKLNLKLITSGESQNLSRCIEYWKWCVNSDLQAVVAFPDAPSEETIRKAKELGIKLLVRNGEEYFLQ